MIYILIIFLSIIHHIWFFNIAPLTYGDWGFFHPDTQKELFRIPYIWANNGLGTVDFGSSMQPVFALWGALSHFFSFGLVERLVYLWPSIIIALFSSYFLTNKIFNSKIAGLIGSLVYAYNTYFILGRTGHLTLMTAFAIAPLVVYFFTKSIKEIGNINVILTVIFGALVSFYEIRAFYILLIVLFLRYLFTLLYSKTLSIRYFLRISTKSFIPIMIILILNFYWLFAYSNVDVLSSNSLFARQLFGNELLNILDAFTLFHPFWTGSKPTDFIIQSIPFYFWVIPIIAFLGLYLNRKNKDVVFFGFIALLGIFLTKQVAQPFSTVYPWLYENFPGFNAFREASKFYFLIALGYSVLIAGFVDWIWKNCKKKGVRTYGKYFLTLLIAFIFLWNTKPLITGEIGTLFVPRQVPKDYQIVKDFILRQDNYFRTFWIPTYSRFSIYTNNHPEVSAINMLTGEWNSILDLKSNNSALEGEQMVELLNQEFSDNLLDQSSIKYVIVPLRDTDNDDDFFIHYGGHPPEFYINSLEELIYLKRIDIRTEEIAIFENEDFRDHIYITNKKESINPSTGSGQAEFQDVEHEMINPTEYKVSLRNVKEPLYINFSESFHPQWKLRIGEFNWWDALVRKEYFAPDANHFKNEAQLNSFYINPSEFCQSFSCKKNSEGSYDIEATIYFRPQSYMYLGLIISISTLTGVLGYLIITLVRRYRRRIVK